MRWAAIAATLGALVAAAPASAAFPGANGRIAFQGTNGLGTINASGGDRQPLIGEAAVFASPAWSPDGQRLAFATNRDGNFEIYVIAAAGGPATRLTNNAAEDGAPAWSPDGSRIAFESDRDGNFEIYAMNADGSGATNLTSSILDDRSPAWSPDGSRIATSTGPPGGGSADIAVIPASGGIAVPLTNDPAHEDNPDWSPDGRNIVFQRGSALVVMGSSAGSGQTPLLLGGSRPSWSPDGSRIVFDVSAELHSANPDGSGVTRLTTAGSAALAAQNPAWQPIAAPGGGGPGGGGPGAGLPSDRIAPTFGRRLTLERTRFRVARGATPVSLAGRRPARGSAFRFSMSEPAQVSIEIARVSQGRRVGRSCRRTTRANRRRPRCTRYTTSGTLRRRAVQGANEVLFTGRIGRRRLAPGRYRASATGKDAAGNTSTPSRAFFTIAPG